jgi:flagellar hook protein FlgE
MVDNVAFLEFNPGTGAFMSMDGNPVGDVMLEFDPSLSNFTNIEINFSNVTMTNNNGIATIGASAGGFGTNRGIGTGRRVGEMIEVIVQDDGKIYANYDNGQSRLLGQIATATFANPSGLEKRGDNLYSASMNSGEFNGTGEDIKVGGGYISSGVLEMSNVDLSAEFTEMITTQRGFQANSRIITVSDTLLEELTNLKR